MKRVAARPTLDVAAGVRIQAGRPLGPQLLERVLDSGEPIDVPATGDSCFHYPFDNLITPFYGSLERPTIFAIGENGAPLDGIRREIVRAPIDHSTLRLDDVVSDNARRDQPAVDLVGSAGMLADPQWANEPHPKPSGFNRIVTQCRSGPARHALGLAS